MEPVVVAKRVLGVASSKQQSDVLGLATHSVSNLSECFQVVGSRLASGHDMLLDTPLAEHFLDFYAVSPNSKAFRLVQ